MTVVMPWPNPARRDNPYMRLLYDALLTFGVEVRAPPPVFSLCARTTGVDWFHIHWPGWLTRSRDRSTTIRKQRAVIETLRRIKQSGTKLLWTMHNLVPHDAPHVEEELRFRRRLLELCDLVHVHFEGATAILRRELGYGGAVVHAAHGTYEGIYPPPIDRDTARGQWRLPRDACVFVSLGLLRSYKNTEMLFDAFGAIPNENARLLVCGKPETRDYGHRLKARLASRPRMDLVARRLTDRQVSTLLSAADVFVLPSRSVFTSGSAMLALTFGVPIVGKEEHHLASFSSQPFFFAWDGRGPDSLSASMQQALSADLQHAREQARSFARTLSWKTTVVPLAEALQGHD